MLKSTLPWMLRSRRKNPDANHCVITVSSAAADGAVGQSIYASTKSAVNGFTMAMAKEVGGMGIRVNAVAPGFIDTDMTGQLSETQKSQALDRITANRFGKVDEVAHAVRFLLENQYVHGQILRIDGGLR
eukprot:TRINITY_DN2237_c0_g1_i2.p1 TRINITY_DN2237_c0_g1~~TRINITY_DN2237_c0_g1_i2.p1  ORF type:complete len:130 (+),score=16.60 TRINITY_DN2237_c0_g1_i2:428-817(+)